MRDVIFVLVVVAFFALAALFVRACEVLVGPTVERGRMSFEDVLGLVLAVLVLGYLLFALIYPERLG